MRSFRPALLTLPLLVMACGNHQVRDTALADAVAQKFVDDVARMPPAPNPKMENDLKVLTACTVQHIRSSVAEGDSDAAVHTKVQAAMQACSDTVYGSAKP
jgi:hypothetical protein